MNVVICDDDKKIVTSIENMLQNTLNHSVNVWGYTKTLNLQKDLGSKLDKVDILIIDINLDYITGIDFVKQNAQYLEKTKIIYITGYDDFIEESFETNLVYLLRKPITEEKLNKAMHKAINEIKKTDKHIMLKVGKDIRKINLADVNYIESQGRTINIYLTNELISTYGKISDIEGMLVNSFVRTHKSYLINIDKVKSYNKNEIILENNKKIPISRKNSEKVQEKIFLFIKNN